MKEGIMSKASDAAVAALEAAPAVRYKRSRKSAPAQLVIDTRGLTPSTAKKHAKKTIDVKPTISPPSARPCARVAQSVPPRTSIASLEHAAAYFQQLDEEELVEEDASPTQSPQPPCSFTPTPSFTENEGWGSSEKEGLDMDTPHTSERLLAPRSEPYKVESWWACSSKVCAPVEVWNIGMHV